MAVPAQKAVWGIAPQAAKIGSGSTVDVTALDWYRYRVPTVTGRGMQDEAVMPLELGGPLVPTGGYKTGAYFVQEVDIIPRLENTLGWLLYATLGNVSSVADKKYNDHGWVTNTGAKGHLFTFNPTDHADIPWLAARLMTPGETSSDNQGEVGFDCKVSGLRLNVPGAGLITGRFGVQGRAWTMPEDTPTNAWVWQNNFEDSKSIAHAGKGSIYIGTTVPKATGVTMDFLNTLTRPQDEYIIGDFNPDDVAVLTRSVRLRASMKWQNSELWRLIHTNDMAGTTFDPLPYFSETVGTTKGFYFESKSPANMPSLSIPYAIRVMANNVMVSVDPGSLRLRAGSIIEYMVNLDVLDPGDGSDYIQVALDNKVSGYVWG